MPYIRKSLRNLLDPRVESLLFLLRDTDAESRKGVANYIVSRIVAGGMKPESGWNYRSLSEARSVFTDAGVEFDRRMMAPYEWGAIARNGDILEYDVAQKRL